jgi:potassium-dependent mechanosensitive channel
MNGRGPGENSVHCCFFSTMGVPFPACRSCLIKPGLNMKYCFSILLALTLLSPTVFLWAQHKDEKGEEKREEKGGTEKKEGSKKDVSGKTDIEYSLDTVMQRLDNMHLTLNRINDFSGQFFDTHKVEQQLPGIQNNLQIIQSNLSIENTIPEARTLQLFGILLNDIQGQLESWRSSLFKYNSDLISMNAEIAAFTKDSLIHQLVKDTMYRKMYLDVVAELQEKWDSASKTTKANLTRIDELQSTVSKLYFQTVDMESRVIVLKREFNGQLFSKAYPYLWESAGVTDSGMRTSDLARRSYRGQRGIMGYFIRQNWDNYLYILALGLLFFFWVWRNFRTIGKSPESQKVIEGLKLRYLHVFPFLSAVIVMLNIIPFFDLDAPAAYSSLVQFFLLISLSILFGRRWPRRYFLYWILIAVLYILFSFTGVVLVPLLNVRLWLLLLNVLSATLGFIAITQIIRHFSFSLVVRIVSIIFLVLNILAILCNLSGRLSLAKIFSSSAIFGLVQIIGLSVFISSLLEALSLQATAARIKSSQDRPGSIYEKIQKSVFRMLMVFSIFTWLIIFSINLNVYDLLYGKIARLMNASRSIGSISFRASNVLIFCLVVYLSNLSQKYIGYLFGAPDGETMPEGGRKGSRLVMIRLILIIAGFLLAVAVSGLPIDKITIVLGALGVGIGLGLQSIVNNLVSGIILIFERPFQIGDYIDLNGKKGIVRDIGIRSSRLVTEEGTEIIMPNADLLSGEVINWTVRSSQVRIEVPVTVEAGHTFEEIKEVVEGALTNHPGLSGDRPPKVLLSTVSDKTMSFIVHAWVANIGQIQTIKSEVLSVLYQQLKEKGIKPQ